MKSKGYKGVRDMTVYADRQLSGIVIIKIMVGKDLAYTLSVLDKHYLAEKTKHGRWRLLSQLVWFVYENFIPEGSRVAEEAVKAMNEVLGVEDKDVSG